MQPQDIRNLLESRLGIARPNAMQEAVWAARARRLIILSPTGSGKTAAFTGAALLRMQPPCGAVQTLILAPSRELVIQISEVARKMAAGYKVAALYGKHSMADETATLSVVPDIIVATPGRMLDHLQRRTVGADSLGVLIIDEYDKALELGFYEEMRRICSRLPHPRNVLLTSATAIAELPPFLDLADAETVDCTAGAADPRSRLSIARVESPVRDKRQTLTDLLRTFDDGSKVIVFVNHRDAAERVYNRLKADGLPVALYHGGLEQIDRERAVVLLNNSTAPVIVATDLAARGLDIDSVSHVVHYHLPSSAEAWTHRNGRTARVDADGSVYVITAEGEDIPDYVVWDREYTPGKPSATPMRRATATLHINAGRKEKISRGDIVGFLVNNAGIDAARIGRIDLRDHMAYVAVPRDALPAVAALQGPKIKGRRVRITRFG